MIEADEYETFEEAYAAALEQVGDGGIVTIHAEDCEHDGEDDDTCSCIPIDLVKGAKA